MQTHPHCTVWEDNTPSCTVWEDNTPPCTVWEDNTPPCTRDMTPDRPRGELDAYCMTARTGPCGCSSSSAALSDTVGCSREGLQPVATVRTASITVMRR